MYNYIKHGDIFDKHRFINENGEPITKTPETHPYSYEPYIIFGKTNQELENGYINGSVYDDRLLQSNYNKFISLKNNILKNNSFETSTKEKIEKFLEAWYDNKYIIVLVRILKGCNVSNGYPYYVLQYHYEERKNGNV